MNRFASSLLVLVALVPAWACTTGGLASEAPGAGGGGRSIADDPLPPGATPSDEFAALHPDFDSYWYQGVAELTRYELVQARYGDQHPGEAVLVYVTEDFLSDRQTKHEFGDDSDAVSVLKLNAYRRFYTGVYPYSVLTSVFMPVAEPDQPALKLTASVQEWCGMTYQQFNRRGGEYAMQLHSYFQAEADQDSTVSGVLEDELWTRIRRGPDSLPVGRLDLIPAAHALRMLHAETRPEPAVVTLGRVERSPAGEEPVMRYAVDYERLDRSVEIFFEPAFPHRIVAWREEQGGGPPTTAVMTRSLMLDYWNRHGAGDDDYRQALGLEW